MKRVKLIAILAVSIIFCFQTNAAWASWWERTPKIPEQSYGSKGYWETAAFAAEKQSTLFLKEGKITVDTVLWWSYYDTVSVIVNASIQDGILKFECKYKKNESSKFIDLYYYEFDIKTRTLKLSNPSGVKGFKGYLLFWSFFSVNEERYLKQIKISPTGEYESSNIPSHGQDVNQYKKEIELFIKRVYFFYDQTKDFPTREFLAYLITELNTVKATIDKNR